MRRATLTTTVAAILIGLVLLCIEATPALTGLFFAPFALGPLCITLLLALLFSERRAEAILLASTVLYMAWFGYLYMDIFHWHPDPQSAIGLLLAGLYALPVMLTFWAVAGRRQHIANHQPIKRT
jgi:hypothetical protein